MNMYQNMTIKELKTELRVGKFARVKWRDVGALDCLVIKKMDEGKITKNTDFKGFFLESGTTDRFSADQVIAVGDYISANTGF